MKRKSDKKDTHRATKKGLKSGKTTDPDRLFKDIALDISDKFMTVGVELGLKYKVLKDELETLGKGSSKAMKMLHLWRDSISEDDCTYSALAAALKMCRLHRFAYKYCYIGMYG